MQAASASWLASALMKQINGAVTLRSSWKAKEHRGLLKITWHYQINMQSVDDLFSIELSEYNQASTYNIEKSERIWNSRTLAKRVHIWNSRTLVKRVRISTTWIAKTKCRRWSVALRISRARTTPPRRASFVQSRPPTRARTHTRYAPNLYPSFVYLQTSFL